MNVHEFNSLLRLVASLCESQVRLPVSVMWPDGSSTKGVGDLYLTALAKTCFSSGLLHPPCLLLPPLIFKTCFSFLQRAHVFTVSSFQVFVYIHWGGKEKGGRITDSRKCSQGRSCSLFFLASSPIFSPSLLKCRQAVIMLLVSKLVSVLGVPGEQPRYNSRVKWAGRGGKMNSVRWGFPNPNSWQGLSDCCVDFCSCLPRLMHQARDEGQRLKTVLRSEWLFHTSPLVSNIVNLQEENV